MMSEHIQGISATFRLAVLTKSLADYIQPTVLCSATLISTLNFSYKFDFNNPPFEHAVQQTF